MVLRDPNRPASLRDGFNQTIIRDWALQPTFRLGTASMSGVNQHAKSREWLSKCDCCISIKHPSSWWSCWKEWNTSIKQYSEFMFYCSICISHKRLLIFSWSYQCIRWRINAGNVLSITLHRFYSIIAIIYLKAIHKRYYFEYNFALNNILKIAKEN